MALVPQNFKFTDETARYGPDDDDDVSVHTSEFSDGSSSVSSSTASSASSFSSAPSSQYTGSSDSGSSYTSASSRGSSIGSGSSSASCLSGYSGYSSQSASTATTASTFVVGAGGEFAEQTNRICEACIGQLELIFEALACGIDEGQATLEDALAAKQMFHRLSRYLKKRHRIIEDIQNELESQLGA